MNTNKNQTIRRCLSYTVGRQRIDLHCVLTSLDRAETEDYIHSHLNYAGLDQELFTSRAIDEIFRISAGTMRIVNRICEKALMYGCQQNRHLIDDQDILRVSEELRSDITILQRHLDTYMSVLPLLESQYVFERHGNSSSDISAKRQQTEPVLLEHALPIRFTED